MIPAETLRADPDLVATWACGWALSRGVAPPVPAYGGFRIDVGLPDQKARYVFAAASDSVRDLSRAIPEPHVFIKVCAPPEAVQPLLSPGWSIRPVGFMMTTQELAQVGYDLRDGYQLIPDLAPHGRVVRILAADGALAASGRAFRVGPTAVFDRIETHPDHRRRGLGRAVMRALGAGAAEDGATKGALVATPDGRALYGSMGWRLHALYTSAVRD
jgi:GNAT superfamily N-acetyltransferase